ncbi:MAG: TolC family outer membrane protein [Desulfuromonas sp.]|nr:TolC family outer membrane protein [Desulfuromonas sp.]
MGKQRNRFFQPLGATLVALMTLAVPLVGGQNALAADQTVGVADSVVAALSYNPRLKVLQTNHEAIGFELDRAKGGYFPRVDISAGYGTEAHSDELTRRGSPGLGIGEGTNYHFYPRGEAAIQMSQLLYDGWETASRVGVEEAKLESAKLRVFDNAEAIALDAIIAHLEVYRQRVLYGLAEKNVRDHEEILSMLDERQKAGAGSIADVTQTQGRLARAKASLAETRGTMKGAEANYQRVVGKLAGDVEYFTVPANLMPKSIEELVQAVEANNPKVNALQYNVKEAEERIELSNSNFQPKVDIELSSTYQDQVESSTTYEHNNQAMVRMRWNLINGWSDVADRKAAISRKFQAANSMDDQRVQVVEEAMKTWAQLQANREQVVDFGDATNQSQKTLESYMKQFTVGQRTLLDVLDARNELFQSSGLLVTAKVNEVIAAERLLALEGKLNESLQLDKTLYTAANNQ